MFGVNPSIVLPIITSWIGLFIISDILVWKDLVLGGLLSSVLDIHLMPVQRTANNLIIHLWRWSKNIKGQTIAQSTIDYGLGVRWTYNAR